ncbi:uncharacterized protein JCM10292_000749 [Rhodotorula paludigena]|uniref:uncharacterized protein n=1 Tax=Rhodotorula paludigena TaxID=86838 RepID=UPI003171E9BB
MFALACVLLAAIPLALAVPAPATRFADDRVAKRTALQTSLTHAYLSKRQSGNVEAALDDLTDMSCSELTPAVRAIECACSTDIVVLMIECGTCLGSEDANTARGFSQACIQIFSSSVGGRASTNTAGSASTTRSASAPSDDSNGQTVLTVGTNLVTVDLPEIESFDPSINYFTRSMTLTGPWSGDGPSTTMEDDEAEATGGAQSGDGDNGATTLLNRRGIFSLAAALGGAAMATVLVL